MALTQTLIPKNWVAAHLPVIFNYTFVLEVDSGQAYAAGGATSQSGKLAMTIFVSNILQVGDRFFLAKDAGGSLYQPQAATVINVIKDGLNYYVVFDVNYDAAVTQLYAYKPTYIQSLMPRFELFIRGVSKGFLRYALRGTSIVIDVREELKSEFAIVPPPTIGIQYPYFMDYHLDYNGVVGKKLLALNSVIDPNVPSNDPDWQFVTASIRCRQVSGVNTGEREAQMRDMNPCGFYTGELRTLGSYYIKDINLGACPLPAYYTFALYERHGSKPDACMLSTIPTTYYSNISTFALGTRLFLDSGLVTEATSGYYKRQDLSGVAGYTPVTGIDSLLIC